MVLYRARLRCASMSGTRVVQTHEQAAAPGYLPLKQCDEGQKGKRRMKQHSVPTDNGGLLKLTPK